jgi:hypothetical protein
LFESSGGQVDEVAYLPELRFALAEPDIDTTSIDNAAHSLESRHFFISAVGSDGYKLYHTATIRKAVSDRRLSLDEATEIKPTMRSIVVAVGDQIGHQKDHERWLAVSTETPPRNGVCSDLETVVGRDTSKEIRKEYIAKGKPSRSPSTRDSDPRVEEFLRWFAGQYQERLGGRYVVKWGKEGKLIKELLATLEVDELQRRAVCLFESDFFNAKDIGVLSSQINKLIPSNSGRPQLAEMTI